MTSDSTHSTVRSGAAAVIVALTAALACALSACNTTEGVGKDIKAAGSGIEKAASDAK